MVGTLSGEEEYSWGKKNKTPAFKRLRRLQHLQKKAINICRIYRKAQVFKNLSKTALRKVYKVSANSTTYKMVRLQKGVWGT